MLGTIPSIQDQFHPSQQPHCAAVVVCVLQLPLEFRRNAMAETFASTVSPPTVELGLGAVPNTQLLATASVSNYASERKYALEHPTWHKPQIMHCPHPSGLPESRGVQVRAAGL